MKHAVYADVHTGEQSFGIISLECALKGTTNVT